MRRDAKQPALRRVVDAEIEHDRMHGAIDDAFHLSRLFFQDEHAAVRTEKRDADGRNQAACFGANGEVGLEHHGPSGRLSLNGCTATTGQAGHSREYCDAEYGQGAAEADAVELNGCDTHAPSQDEPASP